MTCVSRGRPPVSADVEAKVLALRKDGIGLLKIAAAVGCGVGTAHRICAPEVYEAAKERRAARPVELASVHPLSFTGRVEVKKMGDVDKVPAVACVYFIHYGDRLMYVGKARNLRSRCKLSHNSWGGNPDAIQGHAHLVRLLEHYSGGTLSWIVLPDSALSLVEEALIWVLAPEWNVVGQRGGQA